MKSTSQDKKWDGGVPAVVVEPRGQLDVDQYGRMEQVDKSTGQRGDGLAPHELEEWVIWKVLTELRVGMLVMVMGHNRGEEQVGLPLRIPHRGQGYQDEGHRARRGLVDLQQNIGRVTRADRDALERSQHHEPVKDDQVQVVDSLSIRAKVK